MDRKQFPILGSRGATIDFQLVADHGKQANANHYQSVERLAARGGLSWAELHAVLHNRAWQKMDENTAIAECRKLEATYVTRDSIDIGSIIQAISELPGRTSPEDWPEAMLVTAEELEAILRPCLGDE